MELLINKSIVASKLQIAIGYNDEEFKKYCREAQLFDFKKLVREEFFMDLITNKGLPAYQKLLDGGDYTWNDRTYHFEGITTMLSYFAYARFVFDSGAVSTSFGMVIKTNPNSQPLSMEERKNYYYKKQSEAGMLFEEIKKFVERNLPDYPSWNANTGSCNQQQKSNSVTTKVIQ